MSNFTLTAHAQQMCTERAIKLEWIRLTLADPTATQTDQRDPALTNKLRRIPENGGRVLRVVIDPAAIPPRVITLFFDRKASREMP
jgi:hypothetical protein